ncbi:MAG: 3-isopropylmalate dehydratase large subunit [Chloroflexota bacterium]|nr:MAG: 3-isopropylmalate dehydratase large subunit [Chloroflexota bacterium]
MTQTFAEKILAKKAGLSSTEAGQIVEITPDVALSHDNTAPIYGIFQRMGGERVYDPDMHAVILDHATPAPTTKHAENHRIIREFVHDQGIKNFFDVGRGICHQLLVEEGLALPGEVVLGSDSHTPHAGVMGAFGAGIGRTEMASIWAIGRIWLRVPASMKLIVNGQLPPGVTSKDLALRIIGDLKADGALYMSVEWHGEAIEALPLSQRATLTNLMAEMGAKNSYIPPDKKVFDYLDGRARRSYEPIYPDADAVYAQIVEYDAADIEPMVACPHTVDNVKPLAEVAGTRVDQAFLGACTNGRLDDLAAAAEVLKGRKISPRTRMIVIPASSEIYLEALKAGYLETFVKAGAVIESPGCGPCMGNHLGVPAIGEVTISTANRNFRGRMGTKDSEVYLASPIVVAASAVAGEIAHPTAFKR